MKNNKTIISFLFITLLAFPIFAGNIPIKDDSFLDNNPACPKTTYRYWVDTKDNYGKYQWNITGGYFLKGDQLVTDIDEFNFPNVTVVWNSVKSINGNAPKGTITLKVYRRDNPSYVFDNGNRPQDIKSLKDILPQTPQTPVTELNYGIQTIRVTGQQLNFPGIKQSNGNPMPVTKYEWKVPPGWTVIGAELTSDGTYKCNSHFVDVKTDYTNKGSIEVRGVNDCSDSNDYTEYSMPLNFTRKGLGIIEYPKTIIAGQANIYFITVTPISGATYEWQAPQGWSINNGVNTYSGTENNVYIKNGICMTNEKIKVRYRDASHMYSEWIEVPSIMVAPTINIPSEIKQYYPALFSLDMPEANIKRLIWKVNGEEVDTIYNTNNAQISINSSGTVSISAVLTLNGCSEDIVIPPVNINVQETILSISGPSLICDQAIYTIDNLPPGAVVEWSVSNGIITFTSASGDGNRAAVFNQTGYGDSEVHAAVSFNGEDIALSALPVSTCQPSIAGPSLMCPNTTSRFTVQNTMSNITWSSSGSLTYQSSSLNSAFFKSGSSGNGVVHADLGNGIVLSKYVAISEGSGTLTGPSSISPGNSGVYLGELNCPASGTFFWRLVNRNDVSDVAALDTENPSVTVISRTGGIPGTYAWYRLELTAGGSTYTTNISGSLGQKFFLYWNGPILPPDFNLSPNPASGTVTVSLIESEGDETVTMQGYSAMDISTSDISTIQLWSSFGLVKQVQTDQPSYQLDLTGVAPGFYYVHVIKDGQTYRKQLVVQ